LNGKHKIELETLLDDLLARCDVKRRAAHAEASTWTRIGPEYGPTREEQLELLMAAWEMGYVAGRIRG
jgi:hypothetical protein